MKAFVTFLTVWWSYTAWCAAYGPPYADAYGMLVRAAWVMFTAN